MEEENGIVAFPSSDDRKTLTSASETPSKGGGGASIAERRAAKFGFNAGKISTARYRTASPMASPASMSPCLTIPPGISPTALLDSPIMLPNSLAMPSPTTGTFPFPLYHSATGEDGETSNGSDSFKFKPYLDQKSLLGGSTFELQEAEAAKQAVVLEQPYTGFDFPTEFTGRSITNYSVHPCDVVKASNKISIDSKPVGMKLLSPDVVSEQSLSREHINGDENAANDISEANHGAYNPAAGSVVRTSEDGYNWRKYGQKQVKGSEYPRSYYKCTHPNCQVKKKVERSHDGQITEIIYKGAHNHAKPQPSRRPGFGSAFSFDEMSEVSEGSGNCPRLEGGSSVWTNIQSGSDGGLEITSSASILTDLSDPVSTTHGKSIGTIESTETPEQSSTFASHDDDEDGATQGSMMSLGGDVDGEESESKRRKKESCLVETTLTSRAVREPRVVVQIESEVDILDDGYRWRKYGQKVVKGNPNPRSYYKCTSAGCSVRKHVERASHNLKCVITTYEGKHNHEVPAARTGGNHMNSGGPNTATQPVPHNNGQPTMTLPRNTAIPKPETHLHDFPPHFDRKPDFAGDFLRPGFPAGFGPPSIYQMKFPPYAPPPPFGLNPNRFVPQQPNSMPSILPDFPISLPPPPVNLPLVGYDFNSGKPIAPVQPLPPTPPPPPSQQQLHPNDMRFVRPKLEQRDDPVYDVPPSLSAAYSRIMGSFQS